MDIGIYRRAAGAGVLPGRTAPARVLAVLAAALALTGLLACASAAAAARNRKPAVQIAQRRARVAVGQSFTFTATAADPDGDRLEFSWWVGRPGQTLTLVQAGPSSGFTWTPGGPPGLWRVRVTVRDGRGGEAWDMVDVRVDPGQPPPAPPDPPGGGDPPGGSPPGGGTPPPVAVAVESVEASPPAGKRGDAVYLDIRTTPGVQAVRVLLPPALRGISVELGGGRRVTVENRQEQAAPASADGSRWQYRFVLPWNQHLPADGTYVLRVEAYGDGGRTAVRDVAYTVRGHLEVWTPLALPP